MRRLTFRAWDTKRLKMWSAEEMGRDELTLNPDGRGLVNISSTSTRLSQYCPHLIALQFTGLYDADGHEIWEGDIIEDREHQVREVVVFENGMFTGERYASRPIFEVWHVIGNRYEYPEILQQKKDPPA